MRIVGTAGGLLAGSVAACLWHGVAMAQMSHDHGMSHEHGSEQCCAEPTLRCASKVTPTFAPDGSLWLAWAAGGKVSVAHSSDLGRTFTPAIAVNREPLELDWGPDARPKIAVDRDGRVFVAFAIFKDKAFNGQVLYTHSSDGGHTFARPVPDGFVERLRYEIDPQWRGEIPRTILIARDGTTTTIDGVANLESVRAWLGAQSVIR